MSEAASPIWAAANTLSEEGMHMACQKSVFQKTMYAKRDVSFGNGVLCKKGNAYLIDSRDPAAGYGVFTTGGKFLYRTIWGNIIVDFQEA